jgi:hypothetical protein
MIVGFILFLCSYQIHLINSFQNLIFLTFLVKYSVSKLGNKAWETQNICIYALFDVATFDSILTAGFRQQWQNTSIPCNNVNTSDQSWPGARSPDAEDTLGLLLHYLNSTMHEVSLQEIFALIPTTVSRISHLGLKFSCKLLDPCLMLPYAGRE